jgi:hypothetical protein
VSSAEEAVRMLSGLAADDRQWILERLPVEAKARLAEHVDDSRAAAAIPVSAAGAAGFEWSRAVERLRTVNVSALVHALQSEPPWLVRAVLHAADWPWVHEVTRSLPVSLRHEAMSLDRRGTALARPAVEVVLIELAKRSEGWPPAPPPPSRLRAFLQRLRHGRHA